MVSAAGAVSPALPVSSEPRVVESVDGSQLEIFPLPTDEDFLRTLLVEVFEAYWDRIVFGPMIQGAAFEIRCPSAPTKIGFLDGYLTVFFGRTHFHLCIGAHRGSKESPTPAALRTHRRTASAAFFRGLDSRGAPINWGLRLVNGAGEEQITVFFPNPFLSDDDEILKTPDWSRLAVWEALLRRYLGREPDGRDRLATGFAHG